MKNQIEKPSGTAKRVGFIVNPIAGMGGAVGLKGTDGDEILRRAITLGAVPFAPTRAESFLSTFRQLNKGSNLLVGAGCMGEDEAKNCGFDYSAVGGKKSETGPEDTKQTAQLMAEIGLDLLVFCGGDGTARDIQSVVRTSLPVLGVPTGVKMHSAVFAITPKAAARVAGRFISGHLPLKESEVMDIDEAAFRRGQVSAELYGYMLVPYEPHLIQGNKISSQMTESELRNQAAIAVYIIEEMKTDIIYIVGPGTTTRTIADLLDAKKTLLGVDLFTNKTLIAPNVNEKQVLNAIKGKSARIIVTPIGGQGFVFGRGNQQISPKVIHEVGLDNITVIATESKLRNLQSLRVDTGDSGLDASIRNHGLKVVTDYKTQRTMNIE